MVQLEGLVTEIRYAKYEYFTIITSEDMTKVEAFWWTGGEKDKCNLMPSAFMKRGGQKV